jgi:transglutaminase-like putative cysteine protease
VRLSVSHTTRYAFAQPIAYGMQRLRLRPKPTRGQTIVDWTMELDGALRQAEYEDQHHNATMLVSVLPGARELVIRCSGIVETTDNAGIVGKHVGHMPLWALQRQTPLTRPGAALTGLVERLDADRSNPLDVLHALSRAVGSAIAYEPGATEVHTTAEQARAAGRGVCQDHAHAFIGAGRLLDFPMRYVSGYLKLDEQGALESDEPSPEQSCEIKAGQAESATHGWAEAHVPGLGWVGFDVSNEICPDERYIRVATGSDYREAAPITGMSQGGGDASLEVGVTVEQSQSAGQQQQRLGDMVQSQKFD